MMALLGIRGFNRSAETQHCLGLSYSGLEDDPKSVPGTLSEIDEVVLDKSSPFSVARLVKNEAIKYQDLDVR